MTATLMHGDARNIPLPDASVDLVCTSPPYWALRSYTDGGRHYDGQIGAEPTPGAYVDSLIQVTRELVRVLKPSGSLWINLGDKYAGSGGGPQAGGVLTGRGVLGGTPRTPNVGAPPKSLVGLPWRYAIRCIDDLGLILRAEVIWSKPNGLPESVTDRPRRSHEQWFMFTKSPRYFAAVDTIRETYAPDTAARYGREWGVAGRAAAGATSSGQLRSIADGDAGPKDTNPLGKLPGSVWDIPTQPLIVPAHLGVDHFAAYPMEWPRRIIQGWSPSGVCTVCGQGRRPVLQRGGIDPELVARRGGHADQRYSAAVHHGGDPTRRGIGLNVSGTERKLYSTPHAITGEACACPDTTAPTHPAVILDPFVGTGTTLLVADVLGRHGIGLDLSADYLRLARWRCTDPGQRAAAMQVEKPRPELDGQDDLLTLLEAL